MNYKTKLKKEFEQATGLKTEENYKTWLEYKKLHLERQLFFLKHIGLNLNESTIELNKGKYDTLGLVIPSNETLIEISKYGAGIQNSKVFKCIGDLIIQDNKPIISINDNTFSCIDISSNINYIIDLPIYEDIKTDLVKLSMLDKNVFINILGSLYDKDINIKIEKINQFKYLLESNGINCDIQNTVIYDTYLGTLIPQKKYIKK